MEERKWNARKFLDEHTNLWLSLRIACLEAIVQEHLAASIKSLPTKVANYDEMAAAYSDVLRLLCLFPLQIEWRFKFHPWQKIDLRATATLCHFRHWEGIVYDGSISKYHFSLSVLRKENDRGAGNQSMNFNWNHITCMTSLGCLWRSVIIWRDVEFE